MEDFPDPIYPIKTIIMIVIFKLLSVVKEQKITQINMISFSNLIIWMDLKDLP